MSTGNYSCSNIFVPLGATGDADDHADDDDDADDQVDPYAIAEKVKPLLKDKDPFKVQLAILYKYVLDSYDD